MNENKFNLVSGCYKPNSDECKTCLIKDYCNKHPALIHTVTAGEILHPVEIKQPTTKAR